MAPDDQDSNSSGSSPGHSLIDVTVVSEPSLPDSFSLTAGSASARSERLRIEAARLVADNTVVKERFVLEDLLGFGGMGMVFKARDLRKEEAGDREPWVAIKLLNEDFRNHPAALVSLQREARKSQALTHPNIVKVFDFDRDGDLVFMIMEMFSGEDLDQRLRNKADGLGLVESLRLARQMGDALQHAHDNGIIHADFSPKNVFVTDDGQIKVLDFGIAQAIASAEAKSPTGDGTIFDPTTLGGLTPRYASYERFKGRAAVPADDVYALACVIYLLLSGQHPYNNHTATEAYSQAIRPQRPPALSGRQWRALQNALALLREKRYGNVQEFMDEFAPPSNPATGPIAIAAAVVVAVVGVSLLQAYLSSSDEQARAAALAAQENALATSKQVLERDREERLAVTTEELQRINSGYLALAKALIKQHQYDEAEKNLKNVQTGSPDFPGLEDLQLALNRARGAFERQKAVELATRSEVDQRLESARAAIEAGALVRPEVSNALTSLREALVLDPQNAQAILIQQRLVQLHIAGFERSKQRGELDIARRWLEDLSSIDSDDSNLPRLRSELEGEISAAAHRESRVSDLIGEAEKLPGSEAQRSGELYLQVLDIDPGNSVAIVGLRRVKDQLAGERVVENSAVRSRVEQARELLSRRPENPERYREARHLLRDALSIQPDYAPATAALGLLPRQYADAVESNIASGEYALAETFVEAGLELTPGDPTLLRLRNDLSALIRKQDEVLVPASF